MCYSPSAVSVLLFFGLTIGGHAQTVSTGGAIAGIAVSATTDLPIRRAIITLSIMEAQPQDAVAWTDADGRYSFAYLPPGRYQLRAVKDGYQAAAYGADSFRRPPTIIQLAAGQIRNDLNFRLQLSNFISGVVLDEDGDPLAGVQVMAMTPGFQRQRRRLFPGPTAMTDSTGHYRLSGLIPGRYAVVATNQNLNVVKIHPEAKVGETPQQYLYAVQFYPGTDHGDDAALLTVQPGREMSSIDFRLQSRAATTIEGKVMVPSSAVSVKDVVVNVVTQMSQDFDNRFVGGSGATAPEYNFTQSQLAPGSYFLIAQAMIDGRQYRGVQTIELGPQGLRGIAIPVEPGIDLAGNVSVEGPDASQHAAAFVNLVPGDDIPWTAQPLRAKVNKDGTFKIAGVPAGVWDIGVEPLPSAGYVKSMRLGDKDVLTDDMMIRASTAEPLKIVLSTRAATVQGDVQQGDLPARAVVLLAPAGKFRHVMSWYRVGSADEKGHFEIKNATPGEYRLYAFEEFDQRSIQDPDFLTPFEKLGSPVTLREGPNGPEKLSLIPAGAPPPQAHSDSAEVHP